MTRWIIYLLGRCLAALPFSLLAWICRLLGSLIFHAIPNRKRLILSNLHHAFPNKDHAWLIDVAQESCARTIEMGILNLISPFLTADTLKARFTIDTSIITLYNELLQSKRPLLVLTPHFSLMEVQAVMPLLLDYNLPETGIIYRPFKNKNLEQWIKQSRERFGMKLLSRRDGFVASLKILREQGVVGILFDQNAGKQGVLTTAMGRLASTTELPGILVEKFQPIVGAFYVERQGFLSGTLKVDPLGTPPNSIATILTSNAWLDEKLKANTRQCADWLWLHDRWRTQDDYRTRFCLHAKRMAIAETLQFHGWDTLPRTTRYWIRMPNWLGDIIMALPLIRALRQGRPDAAITLLVQPHYIPLLEKFKLAESLIPLPPKSKLGYFSAFKKMRQAYPDVQILFTNSLRSDLEAKCIGAPQRFGMERPNKPRKYLTHTWKVPSDLDETTLHQTRVWERYFQHFGLKEPLDLSPFALPSPHDHAQSSSQPIRIALFCGSENAPEKRWPISSWQQLINDLAQHLNAEFHLLGTAKDRAITTPIKKGCPQAYVINSAGKTPIDALTALLPSCQLAIGNDSGGMHIANALGVPSIGIYGPTNPVRTGPIFEAIHTIIQPDNCPATGGFPIDQVSHQSVFNAATSIINQS